MNKTYFELVNITPEGITVKSKKNIMRIRFDECAKKYAQKNFLGQSKCVAERDVTKCCFTFYTDPQITVIFKKSFFKDLFSSKNSTSKFFELQQAIIKYGYTSYDLS